MTPVKKPRGIHCPVCGAQARHPTAQYRPIAGKRVRYWKCKCGAKFKSTERLDYPSKP